MKKVILILSFVLAASFTLFAQDDAFNKLDFLIGSWSGEGTGFGNSKSEITAEYKYVMDGNFIEVVHESFFEPTDKNREGEHHIDKGMISFDKSRNRLVYRQFNIEGFFNRYVLVDSLSNNEKLVFETESIENFVPGGKARFTIIKTGKVEIKTIFDLSFPGKEFACYGTNILHKIE